MSFYRPNRKLKRKKQIEIKLKESLIEPKTFNKLKTVEIIGSETVRKQIITIREYEKTYRKMTIKERRLKQFKKTFLLNCFFISFSIFLIYLTYSYV